MKKNRLSDRSSGKRVSLATATASPEGSGATIQYISAGEVLQPGPAWYMPCHAHSHHEMIVICGGEMEVEIRGRRLRGRSGDALLYPADEGHEEWTDPERVVHTIFLAFRCRLPEDIPLRVHDADGRLRQIAAWLRHERDWHAPLADRLRNSFLAALVAEYLRLSIARHDIFVEHIRAFIREHLGDKLTLDDLASHAHMSRYHFLRRYRQLTGRTPMDEVRSMRLDYARDLLLTTYLPIKTIAVRAGLGDPYHLSKLFRRHFNLRPSELRRLQPGKVSSKNPN